MTNQTYSLTLSRHTKAKARSQSQMRPASQALQELSLQKGEHFWSFLADIFDNLPTGLMVADRSGRVMVFNRAAGAILGYGSAEVIRQVSLWDFCEECARPPLFRESLLNGQSFPEEEVEMQRKDGAHGPVGVKVTPLYGPDGGLAGALATLRSLDEIRAQERERKSLVRLASIGRIISSVAHEINNPLQTVRAALELGLDPRKTAARRQEYLQAADHEICRISRIIAQMRTFYRPEPGQKGPTEVNQTLQEVLGMLTKQLDEAAVKVELHLSEDLPPINLIDYQLQQVFLNLVLNALDAMPQGGHLKITTRLEAQDLLVLFTDDAPALAPHEAADLFDPMAINGRTGELALGLSLSREIITEFGGSIEFYSHTGNTLVVRLPWLG